MGTIPPPILSPEYWSDVDASTFRIRGNTYNLDKVKAPSAPSIFKLIAIDVNKYNRNSSIVFICICCLSIFKLIATDVSKEKRCDINYVDLFVFTFYYVFNIQINRYRFK